MADEIRVVGALTAYKAAIMGHAQSWAPSEQTIDMSGSVFASGTIAVGISAEAIPLGEVTSPGWSFFHNLHATGVINIRNGASGADVIELKAGEWCIVRLEGTSTPYVIASGASTTFNYVILSD